MKQTRGAGRILDIALPCLLLAVAAFNIASIFSYDIVFEALIDGSSIGYVSSFEELENAKLELEAEISEDIGSSETLSEQLSYRIAYTIAPEFLTEDECREAVEIAASDEYITGNMLRIDGVMAAASTSAEELDELIEEISDELLENAVGYDRIELNSEITIEEQYCPVEYFCDISEINDLINPLSEHESIRVSAFSSLSPSDSDSSRSSRTSASELTLDYMLISTETADEVIEYETVYIDDPDRLVGRDILLQEGSDGCRTVTYEITSDENGNELYRVELSETIHTAAVEEIIRRGTKPIPEAGATIGTFIAPCEAKKGISSGYGGRDLYGSYDFHLGIDLPGTKGDPIYAADGGEVIWAGYTPSYGNSVRIQHDGEVITLYAHMSKLLVSVGDKVYQGQQIGEMGQTGAAYGVHLHFEIRHGSLTVNPLDYVVIPEVTDDEIAQLEAGQAWEARKFNK